MNKGRFLTIEEVAQNLKVARQTVSKYIRNKDLNAVKINSVRKKTSHFEVFDKKISKTRLVKFLIVKSLYL